MRTRRRLIAAAFVMALTIPAETILLNALQTPDPRTAVRNWVASLSFDDLQTVSARISEYPFTYRREIMRALPPVIRAAIWQAHIRTYIFVHQELDPSAVALLKAMISEITPETLSRPSADTLARVNALGMEIKATLGADRSDFLLYRLGPKDGTFASIEPMSQRLANAVRRTFIALAESQPDCDCNIDWGGCGLGVCKDGTGCAPDDDWPMCGFLWSSTCDGKCGFPNPRD